jgi:hypothetical protein
MSVFRLVTQEAATSRLSFSFSTTRLAIVQVSTWATPRQLVLPLISLTTEVTMSISNANPTKETIHSRFARAALGRLCLPWRAWLKIVAGLDFPNPLANRVLGALVVAWVSAYVNWHIRR